MAENTNDNKKDNRNTRERSDSKGGDRNRRPSNRRYSKGGSGGGNRNRRPGGGGRGEQPSKNAQTKEIFISSTPFESRVALLEKGRLAEFYVERPKDRGITGNIYKGKVVSVLPGMQAAFIDMGLDRTAFLHASDLTQSFEGFETEEEEDTSAKDTSAVDASATDTSVPESTEKTEQAVTSETSQVVTAESSSAPVEGSSEPKENLTEETKEATAAAVETTATPTAPAQVDENIGRTDIIQVPSVVSTEVTSNNEASETPSTEETSAEVPAEETNITTSSESVSEEAVTTVEANPQEVTPSETSESEPSQSEEKSSTEETTSPETIETPAREDTKESAEASTETSRNKPSGDRDKRKGGRGGRDFKRGGSRGGGRFKREPRKDPRIEDICKQGDEHIMQITKEPLGSKGARVSGFVSLPGRYLVLMPSYSKIGVSRRISTDRERRRLRSIVRDLRPDASYGFIVRTVCDGVSKEDLKTDMDYLVRLWQGIEKRGEKKNTPLMLSEELDLTLRVIRDMFSADVSRILLDSKEDFDRVMAFADEFMPKMKKYIHLYKGGDVHMFDSFGIEVELTSALGNKVWLRSGGHLVIDQMEALTAVDVNTGKFVGKKSSDDTILKTNLEAVREVVHQIRLRNIGGIIVIDFIDMARYQDRDKVYRALKDALRIDKARTNILKVSDLGLVEMTRKRLRESITQTLCESCPQCEGSGVIKNKDSIVMDIYRDLSHELDKKARKLTLFTSTEIADYLTSGVKILDDLKNRYKTKIALEPIEVFSQEEYEIH